MKSLAYSEQKILQSLPGITLITLGKPYFIAKEGMLTDEQRKTWGNHIRIYPAGHPPKDYREMTLKGIEQAIDAVSKTTTWSSWTNIIWHAGMIWQQRKIREKF